MTWDTVDYSWWQIEKLELWHWGLVTDSQRVTWRAFAILAMFWVRPSKQCIIWNHRSLIKNLTSEHFCCAWPQRQRLPRAANKQRPWSKTKQLRGKTSVLKLYYQWLSPFNGPAFDYCLNLTLTDSLHCLLSSCHLIGLLKMLTQSWCWCWWKCSWYFDKRLSIAIS